MGTSIGKISGAGNNVLLTGQTNGNAKSIITPPDPPDGGIKLPESPFPKINAANPFSWYKNISDFMSGLNKSMMDVENKLTDSVLGGDGDPNLLRQVKFQISALLGKMYDILKYLVEWVKQNKESEKDTIELAFAAK